MKKYNRVDFKPILLLKASLWLALCVGMINCTESFVPTTIVVDPNAGNVSGGTGVGGAGTGTGGTGTGTGGTGTGTGGTGTGTGGTGTGTGGTGTGGTNNGGGSTGGTGNPDLNPTAGSNTYSDSPTMLFVDNGTLRIGLNTALGGALTYVSPSNTLGTFFNMVNNYDLGRQIQQAYISEPVASVAPPPEDQDLWNPNQAGDIFRNKPPAAIEYRRSGYTIYVKATPMIWALKNVPCECMMETWVELQNNVIKYRGRFTNYRSDKNFYGSHYQSIPAMFLNGGYNKVVTYSDNQPFTNGSLTRYDLAVAEKFIFGSENWAALVNKSDYGMGVWSDNVHQFVSGASGWWTDGIFEPDFHENHIIPVQLEHLDHNIVYDFQAEFIVGKVADIRQYVYNKFRTVKLPDFRFKKDRQHWSFINDLKDTGLPVQNEELVIRPLNAGGQMFGPHVLWNASDIPKIYIKMAHKSKAKHARLFWRKFGDTQNFADNQSITFDIIPDGEYHTYALDLSKIPAWNGSIIQLLFAPFGYGAVSTSDEVRLKSISYSAE